MSLKLGPWNKGQRATAPRVCPVAYYQFSPPQVTQTEIMFHCIRLQEGPIFSLSLGTHSCMPIVRLLLYPPVEGYKL